MPQLKSTRHSSQGLARVEPTAEPRLTVLRPPPRMPGELRQNLCAIMGDGILCSFMVAAGEMCFALFVLALGMGEVAAGQIATVPVLAGAVLQLASPWAVARLKSLRTWVAVMVTVQALSLLVLALAPAAGWFTKALVFLTVTLYWASAFGANPAWNTWMEDLVPRRLRARFFARRVRACQVVLLCTIVASGLALKFGESSNHSLLMFAALFGFAGIARLISVSFIMRQSETGLAYVDGPHLGLREMLGRLQTGSGLKLIRYLLAVQMVVYISGPYFTPYMREELKFTYWEMMLITATAFLGRVVALPWLGKLAHQAGPLRLMWFGGIGIVPLSALWLVSDNFYYVCGVQFLCGVFWGGYELAMFLMFFEAIPKAQRTSMLTIYHFGNSVAIVLGGFVGAYVLTSFGHDKSVYHSLFVASSFLRIACLLFLWRVTTTADEEQQGAAAAEVASAAMQATPQLEGAKLPGFSEGDGAKLQPAREPLPL